MDNRVRSNPAGLLLLTLIAAAVPVLVYASALAGGSQDPLLQIPFQVAAIAALAFAVLLVPGLALSWLRWLRGRPAVLRPLLWSLGIALIFLCLDMKLWRVWTEPPKGYLPEGVEVRKRSVFDVLRMGWHDGSVRLGLQQPGAAGSRLSQPDMQAPPQALCIAEVTVTNGLLQVTRQLGMDPALALRPDADFSDELEQCRQERQAYVMARGRLEQLLMTPGATPESLREAFDDNMAEDGRLPLLGEELPEPWASGLADLRFQYGEPVAESLHLFDLALMLEDPKLIESVFPADGPLPYQRYALARLGLQDMAAPFAPAQARQQGSLWSALQFFGHDLEALEQPGGYQPVDFLFANGACDADYATMLLERGMAPTRLDALDLMLRLAPAVGPGRHDDFGMIIALSRRQAVDCAALASLYADRTDMFDDRDASANAQALASRLGRQTLAAYKDVADQALAALSAEERAQDAKVDAVYEDLSFTADEYPVPQGLRAYAAMYGKHYSFGAVCGTLSYAPWAVFHPEITDAYRGLWRGWKGVLPDEAGDELARNCRLPLLHPSGLYEPQTALRNELLELAGLPCRIRLQERDGYEPLSVMECQP